MPNYEFECPKCGIFEKVLKMAHSKEPQECPTCGGDTKKLISRTGFVLRGDSWPGKAMRIKSQMARKNKRLDIKQKEQLRDQPPVTLAPNVDGERTKDWHEAQKLAKSKGKDTSSYEPFVRQEKTAR